MNEKRIRRLGIMIANYMSLTNQLKEKMKKLQDLCIEQQKEIKKLKKQVKNYEQTIRKTKRITGIR